VPALELAHVLVMLPASLSRVLRMRLTRNRQSILLAGLMDGSTLQVPDSAGAVHDA
jgi:hypothetical protein